MGIDGAYASGAAMAQQHFTENDLKQQQIDETSAANIQKEATKQIESTMSHIEGLVGAAAKAGQSPEDIIDNPAVKSLLGSAQGLAQRIGQDPEVLSARVKSLALLPITEPKSGGKPMTEIGKLRADKDAGLITEGEFTARVNRLTAPAHEPNAVEAIRRKVAAGEPLSPGETKVYSDAISGSPLAKALMGLGGGGMTPQPAAQPAPAPAPAAPAAPSQSFQNESEVMAAIKSGSVKVGDVITVGGKRMKVNP